MNELEAWEEILLEWKQVKRQRKLNQELYDLLGGSFTYLLDYSNRHKIILPNRDRLDSMLGRIHNLMIEIEKPLENETNRKLTRGTDTDKLTEPQNLESKTTSYHLMHTTKQSQQQSLHTT